MASAACDHCGKPFPPRAGKRFCGETCRAAAFKARQRGQRAGETPKSTDVADALSVELEQLEMAASYEGRVAVGIAQQLDNGTVVGAAYASLSKELDRRVDALRLKAERADDPAKVIRDRLEAKRAKLA